MKKTTGAEGPINPEASRHVRIYELSLKVKGHLIKAVLWELFSVGSGVTFFFFFSQPLAIITDHAEREQQSACLFIDARLGGLWRGAWKRRLSVAERGASAEGGGAVPCAALCPRGR